MNGQSFSWRDVFIGLSCGLVVLSIALVKIVHHRDLARADTCSNNLKNIGLAIHNYHSAYKQLPINSGGTSALPRARSWQSNADRLSVWVGLLPFMEQQQLWEKISNPYRTSTQTFPSMGPVPWYDADIYKPWSERPARLVCPNDRGSSEHPLAASYVLNYGDAIDAVGTPPSQDRLAMMIGRVSKRGMFMSKREMKFRDILDGLANTLMISESKIAGPQIAKDVSGLVLNPSLCLTAHKNPNTKFWPDGRGAIWTDGIYRSAAFQTILPPNSLSCTSDQGDMEGVLSASSYHADGVHVCFADGRVRYVTNAIDAGDSTSASVAFQREGLQGAANPGSRSPYGLWGALGTRAAKERIEVPERFVMEPRQEISKRRKQEIMSQPLQTWAAADGKTTWEGWQTDLQSESWLILLTPSEDVQRISLADLNSTDAYRAVQQHLQEMLDARTRLQSQLETGVKLLEQRKFTQFAQDYVVGGNLDAKSMGAFIAPQRGLILHAFESSLRQLDDANAQPLDLTETAGEPLSVRMDFDRITRAMPNLQLKYIDGRWKLSP